MLAHFKDNFTRKKGDLRGDTKKITHLIQKDLLNLGFEPEFSCLKIVKDNDDAIQILTNLGVEPLLSKL